MTNNKMEQVGVLYHNTSKAGGEYLSGNFEGKKIVAFNNISVKDGKKLVITNIYYSGFFYYQRRLLPCL